MLGPHPLGACDMEASVMDESMQGSMPESAQGSAGGTGTIEMQKGDDFVCPNCDCEIMLKHHGDPAKMQRMEMFTCCCGTPMEFEHPRS